MSNDCRGTSCSRCLAAEGKLRRLGASLDNVLPEHGSTWPPTSTRPCHSIGSYALAGASPHCRRSRVKPCDEDQFVVLEPGVRSYHIPPILTC